MLPADGTMIAAKRYHKTGGANGLREVGVDPAAMQPV
jgi:hypothetical protein